MQYFFRFCKIIKKVLIPSILLQGEGWLGYLDLWSCKKKPWWNWYLTPVVNFSEVWRAQLAKSTLISTLVPLWFFLDLVKSIQMLKRVGCGKQQEATYSVSGKTAALVLQFAVEDLPSAELQSRLLCLQWRTCQCAEHTDDVIAQPFNLTYQWNSHKEGI